MNFSINYNKAIQLKNTYKNEGLKLFNILFDQGFTSVTSFLTTVVLSRVWAINDYANFVLLMSMTMLLLGFQRAIITQPYVININDFLEGEKEKYLFSNIWFKLVFTVGIVFILPVILIFNKSSIDSNLLILFLIFIIAHSSFHFVKDIFLSNRETMKNLKYSLSSNIFLAVILAYIYYYNEKDVSFFILSITSIYSISFFIFCWKKKDFISLKMKEALIYFKYNWRVGRWILGSNLFYNISTQVYPWLLLWFVSKEEVAVYGVLISISSLVSPFLKSLSLYLLPLFTTSSKDYNKLRRTVGKWIGVFAGFSVLVILVGLYGGEYLIHFFFGEKFRNLGFIVVLPFINQGINILFQPLDIAFNAIKRTDVGFWLLIFRSSIALVIGFILVKNFGIVGVFATRIIESLLYQFAQLYLFKKILK